MEDSIFTKIVNGEIPCHKIYEDDLTLAFLDIFPSKPGHVLVITKKQVDQYIDLPDEDYAALWQSVKKIAKQLRDKTGKERVRLVINGTDVPHTHVHLIPFTDGEPFLSEADRIAQEPDHESLAALATELAMPAA